MEKKLTSNQRNMLRRRGLDPKDYRFYKETYTSLYVINVKTQKMKILTKGDRYG